MKLTDSHRCAGRIRAAKHAIQIAVERAPNKKLKKKCETALAKLQSLEEDIEEVLARERK